MSAIDELVKAADGIIEAECTYCTYCNCPSGCDEFCEYLPLRRATKTIKQWQAGANKKLWDAYSESDLVSGDFAIRQCAANRIRNAITEIVGANPINWKGART